MAELSHYFGSDLQVSPTGDLSLASGSQAGQQRVLRRLLTNATDYIFHTDYGAGLPAQVGQPLDMAGIKAAISGQMLLEPSVAQKPPPVVTVTPIAGGVACSVRYTDATSGAPVSLSFDVNR